MVVTLGNPGNGAAAIVLQDTVKMAVLRTDIGSDGCVDGQDRAHVLRPANALLANVHGRRRCACASSQARLRVAMVVAMWGWY